MSKDAYEPGKLDPKAERILNERDDIESETMYQGTFHSKLVEAVPNYWPGEGDKVLAGTNNSRIVLGRDRDRNIASGYGGRGDTGAGAITFTVGSMGYQGTPDSMAHCGPNFKTDAATIYMSQKSDIDDYFNLAPGTVGNVKTKSCVGIKADAVRIVGREGLKFCTTTDSIISSGHKAKSISHINFLAGNNEDMLEPLVKGKRLVKALRQIIKAIGDINQTLNTFVTTQMAFNAAVTTHAHAIMPLPAPPGAQVAIPSPALIAAGCAAAINTGTNVCTATPINMANLKGSEFQALHNLALNNILSETVHTT